VSETADLRQIEAIKRLKARYFRCIDTKDWAGMREVYARDAVMNDEESKSLWRGREEIVAGLELWLSRAVTVHHGHMPEIELTGPDSARGIWSMFDRVDHPEFLLEGYGHYHERYVIEDGAWRIAELRLSRLHVTRTPK
jgi:uncharacterized protein (TIGR02246 family)